MKTTTLLTITSSLLSLSLITACGGGGGGGGGGGAAAAAGTTAPTATPAPYNQTLHDQLAQEFITAATSEGLSYTLVKADTQQQGYIVVQEGDGTYEAFDVDNWTPGTSVSTFLADYSQLAPAGNNTYIANVSSGYENIVWVPSGYWSYDASGDYIYTDTSSNVDEGWVDTSSTLTFEVAQPSTKDLQKLAAFKQAYAIEASSKKVQQKFGLSLERSTQVAKLALQVKNTPKMSDDDYDSLSKQLLGVPVSKLDAAIQKTQNNDSTASDDINDIINQAATTNGVGPEEARSLLNSMTGVSVAAPAASSTDTSAKTATAAK